MPVTTVTEDAQSCFFYHTAIFVVFILYVFPIYALFRNASLNVATCTVGVGGAACLLESPLVSSALALSPRHPAESIVGICSCNTSTVSLALYLSVLTISCCYGSCVRINEFCTACSNIISNRSSYAIGCNPTRFTIATIVIFHYPSAGICNCLHIAPWVVSLCGGTSSGICHTDCISSIFVCGASTATMLVTDNPTSCIIFKAFGSGTLAIFVCNGRHLSLVVISGSLTYADAFRSDSLGLDLTPSTVIVFFHPRRCCMVFFLVIATSPTDATPSCFIT